MSKRRILSDLDRSVVLCWRPRRSGDSHDTFRTQFFETVSDCVKNDFRGSRAENIGNVPTPGVPENTTGRMWCDARRSDFDDLDLIRWSDRW